MERHADTESLGELIEDHATEISERWLARAQSDAGSPDVHPTQLKDGIPHYLAELAKLLKADGEGLGTRGAESWCRVAREHGVTRVKIGFDIDQLIREFTMLRSVIREVAREHGIEVAHADATLADLIDAAIAESVRAYAQARDRELRGLQAQHVGFITHELRNPLSAAVSATELLRMHGIPAQERVLAVLERNHQKMTELIATVLVGERLHAEAVEPQLEELDLRELLDTATSVARKRAEDKGLELVVTCASPMPVRVDRTLTESAVQNLVDNAVKYTDRGRVGVDVDETDTTWTVHVRDSGPGLSRAELETIFEPFKRGSTGDGKDGTGLGLAIARRAIEAQGGTIHAASPDAGCHFWFTLPKG